MILPHADELPNLIRRPSYHSFRKWNKGAKMEVYHTSSLTWGNIFLLEEHIKLCYRKQEDRYHLQFILFSNVNLAFHFFIMNTFVKTCCISLPTIYIHNIHNYAEELRKGFKVLFVYKQQVVNVRTRYLWSHEDVSQLIENSGSGSNST